MAPPTPSALRRIQSDDPVARIRDGDAAAFEELFLEHYEGMCAFVHSLVHSREAAEELVQDIFLRLWENRDRWHVTDGVRAYLYGAARNQAMNHLKHLRIESRWRTETQRIPLSDRPPTLDSSADARASMSDVAIAVQRAIDALPERCRLVFILHRQRHLSYREIATALAISPKTVEVQIGRALKAIRLAVDPFI
jgi:RNA polymerase sigma-70 factor (ECF subfamily)